MTTDVLAPPSADEAPEKAPDKALMTIAEFCQRHNISVGLYHKLRRAGRGPEVVEILGAVRITPQAAEAWVKRLQAESNQERAAQPGGMSSARPDRAARMGRPAGAGTGQQPRRKAVQATYPSGKPIGRPRKTDAPAGR